MAKNSNIFDKLKEIIDTYQLAAKGLKFFQQRLIISKFLYCGVNNLFWDEVVFSSAFL